MFEFKHPKYYKNLRKLYRSRNRDQAISDQAATADGERAPGTGPKIQLKKLVDKLNKENEPPGGWQASDKIKDKPEGGKTYALTGGPNDKCILNGNSWKESEC